MWAETLGSPPPDFVSKYLDMPFFCVFDETNTLDIRMLDMQNIV